MAQHPTHPDRRTTARLALVIAALSLGCDEGKDDSAATDDTAPQVETFGGSCDPDAASWSEGDYKQLGVLVDVSQERCDAISGHDSAAFLSFDQMHGSTTTGSVGAGLQITGTEPTGHMGTGGYTLDNLELGQPLTVFVSDDSRDYTAVLTLDAVGISGVAVTWVEQL